MYINGPKTAAAKMVNVLIIVVLSILLFFNILFILFLLFTPDYFLAAFFLIPFALIGAGLIIWRAGAIRRLGRARYYNSLFEEDHDGILTYESIASMMGLSQDKAIRELLWMSKKGYLTNMTLGRTAVRVDLTVDPNEFKVLICKTCGSQVRVRRGGGGRCDHCGTFMKDEGAADV